MFEFVTDPEERGQVGIGTLIVFIAMVLVAAIAAGVLINTAGFLQTKSEATGEESTSQVSNRVVVVDATGNVTDEASAPDEDTIDMVNVSVMRSAGSDNINLSRATIQWIGPNEATTLTHTDAAASKNGLSGEGAVFATSEIRETANEGQVLSSEDSRAKITMYVPSIESDSGTQSPYNTLTEGDEVEITITTQFGSQTPYILNVPESLQDKQAVGL